MSNIWLGISWVQYNIILVLSETVLSRCDRSFFPYGVRDLTIIMLNSILAFSVYTLNMVLLNLCEWIVKCVTNVCNHFKCNRLFAHSRVNSKTIRFLSFLRFYTSYFPCDGQTGTHLARAMEMTTNLNILFS